MEAVLRELLLPGELLLLPWALPCVTAPSQPTGLHWFSMVCRMLTKCSQKEMLVFLIPQQYRADPLTVDLPVIIIFL